MQQLIQLLVVLLLVGGPIIGKLLQWISEQKQLKERQKAAEQARLEALRTGRPLETVVVAQEQPSPTERMQELARRRQEQLQELRRRQLAARQQQGQTRAPTTPPTTARPAPGRPAPPRIPPTAPHPGPRSPGPRPGIPGRPAPTVQRPRPATPRSAPPGPTAPPPAKAAGPGGVAREAARREQAEHAPKPAPQAQPASPKPAPGVAGAKPLALLGQDMTPADWRRFIIARELLGAPLALRGPHEGAPAGW